jgi:glycosyltransferase involved in cell wall biosynthesis
MKYRKSLGSITILGTLPPLRGLSSYCREFAIAMANTRRVEFLSFKSLYPSALYPGGKLKEDDSFPPVEHEHLTIRTRLKWYNPLTWLIEGMAATGDMLHAQWWSLPLAPIYMTICMCFRLRGKPVVITIHNVMPHERSHLYKTISSILFRLGNHFIVHTEQNRQQLMAQYGVSPQRISVIAHGPLEFLTAENKDRKTLRQELGVFANEKILLCWGAIRPYKGLDTMLTAFAKILKRLPETRLVIAGKLWESWSRYQSLLDRLHIGNQLILHLHYIPAGEAAGYFIAADLVLLPYHHFDSQSGVGAAAVAFKKPLIVSDTGGLPDFVRNRRWVVPPANPDALAEVVIDCLSDSRRLDAMAQDSADIAAELSWSGIVKKTNFVYRHLGCGEARWDI